MLIKRKPLNQRTFLLLDESTALYRRLSRRHNRITAGQTSTEKANISRYSHVLAASL